MWALLGATKLTIAELAVATFFGMTAAPTFWGGATTSVHPVVEAEKLPCDKPPCWKASEFITAGRGTAGCGTVDCRVVVDCGAANLMCEPRPWNFALYT